MEESVASQQAINSIATELVLLKASDPRACTQILDMFQALKKNPSTTGRIRKLADQASEVVRKLIFEEYDSPDVGEKELGKIVSMMQTLDQQTEEETAEPEQGERDKLLAEFAGKREARLTRLGEEIEAIDEGDKKALKRTIHMIRSWAEETAVLELHEMTAFLQEAKSTIELEKDTSKLVKVLGKIRARLEEVFAVLEIENQPETSSETGVSNASESKETHAAEETGTPAAVSETTTGEKRFTLPSDIDVTLATEFQSEALEHIQNAEVSLLDIETDPEDKEAVNVVFRAFHTIKGVAGFLGLEYLTDLAHVAETFLDRARKGSLTLVEGNADLAFEALDGLKFLVENLLDSVDRGYAEACPNYDELQHLLEHPEEITDRKKKEPPPEKPRVGDILVESGAASLKDVEEAANEQAQGGQKPLGEILVRTGKAQAKEVAKALQQQKLPENPKAKSQDVDAMVKVGTARLDNLINYVGELVIAEAMVSQDNLVQTSSDHNLKKKVGHLGKITRSLQELALSMRMVSVKATFQKMARLVRDLSRKSGKEVILKLEGEDTELDRNMVELIADPLVHLVRNAVDHGIEPAEERERNGKPSAGNITLGAMHEGGGVVITLQDDGGGLPLEKIRRKAIEKGLINPDAELTDAEVHRLIFQPGFSTASQVTDVSGRGVGMDVVRSNIEKSRGNVEVSSIPGKGSTFVLRLPLTLAIIDGMVVRVGSEEYIIPTIMITESLRPRADQLFSVEQKGEMIQLRGSLVPLFRLHRLFNITDALQEPKDAILVVAESNTKRCAIMVDEIMDQQQVVIKNLGTVFKNAKSVSGGAIMGDGRVALILDIEGIVCAATNSP